MLFYKRILSYINTLLIHRQLLINQAYHEINFNLDYGQLLDNNLLWRMYLHDVPKWLLICMVGKKIYKGDEALYCM